MKRLGFWTLIVGLAAIAGGALSYRPWKAFLEQRATAAQHRAEMVEAEKHSAALAREKADLESSKGREAQARGHGFVKPGEKPVDDL